MRVADIYNQIFKQNSPKVSKKNSALRVLRTAYERKTLAYSIKNRNARKKTVRMSSIKKGLHEWFWNESTGHLCCKKFQVLSWTLGVCHCFPHNFRTKSDNVSVQKDLENSRNTLRISPITQRLHHSLKNKGTRHLYQIFQTKSPKNFKKRFFFNFEINVWYPHFWMSDEISAL